jgi:hypothetical protein
MGRERQPTREEPEVAGRQRRSELPDPRNEVGEDPHSTSVALAANESNQRLGRL